MEDSPSKPSVAELAGRFKGHILPTPNSNEELPFRRRPPCSLKLRNQTDNNEESDKSTVFPAPSKLKMKNSAIIEKLQANLALSPTALLPSPKSPEVKLQPAPPSPTTPRSPLSPLTPLSPGQQPSHLSSEEEEPSGFDGPPDGALLPSINKTRARLSFKRRPPTRQHRRSAGEEAGAFGGGLSQSELCSPEENGDKDRDSEEEEEEEAEGRQLDGLEAGECQDVNCDEADAEAAEDQGDLRQEADGSKEEKLKPAGHGEQEEREEEREHDRM
ncbi:capZ-interacting protein [Salarias fasciatus]|nr:capZ-interacting protein-like [Salarias fasciatus]